MKLRNKKTGVIIEPDRVAVIKNTKETDTASFNRIAANYYSLAELNEEWEDYKPKEPKLEGDVSEIVRHWANLHGYNRLSVVFIKRGSERIFSVVSPDATRRIEFSGAYVADDFDAGEYTIAELCGEEEE